MINPGRLNLCLPAQVGTCMPTVPKIRVLEMYTVHHAFFFNYLVYLQFIYSFVSDWESNLTPLEEVALVKCFHYISYYRIILDL